MAKKKAKLSKNEQKAAKAGVSVKAYNAAKKSSSSSSKKSSSSSNSKLKSILKNAGVWDAYQNLGSDQQELLAYQYTIGAADSKDKAKKLQEALDEATAQADPYWKSFLNVAKDEIVRAFDDTKNNFAYQKNDLETKIQQIGEDLTKNRDFYTLEQQSDLAKLKQSYEQQRTGVIEDAAAKGQTFNTQREVPLKQLEDYNTNVVESTNRAYAQKQDALTTEASRGTLDATNKLGQLDTELQAKLTDIGRTAEQKLGTANLPTLEGYTTLGNVSGDFYENKVKDIADRQDAIFNDKIQTSLQF